MTACGLGLVDRHLAGQLRPPSGTAGPAFGLLGCIGSGFSERLFRSASLQFTPAGIVGGGIRLQLCLSSAARRPCPARIPRLVDSINRREIQLSGQVQQEQHQLVRRQPLHRRRWQQQRLLRVPRTEGFGLAHAQLLRPDSLLSLGSGQIGGRLWRGGRWGYVRQAPSNAFWVLSAYTRL